MGEIVPGTVGIIPAGALGVSFFYHLTRELANRDGKVFFLDRKESRSAQALKEAGCLRIKQHGAIVEVPVSEVLGGTLSDCEAEGRLPEVIIFCPNPDQLLGLLSEAVRLLESMSEKGALQTDNFLFPTFVLSSNGIYFQRVRQLFIEKLEESTLLGRLPDLWPDLMPRIVGKLLRGISIQTGIRDGDGPSAIYRPGERGITRLAGGEMRVREKCCAMLKERGGWFELAANSSATRLEFDKAQVNLVANLLGQLYAIDEEGRFRLLTVEEIVSEAHLPEIRELSYQVFLVGRAVKAYSASDTFEELFKTVVTTARMHADHVPSSLQWVGLLLAQGKLKPQMTPTELWLLEPLVRYARSAGLEEAVEYFERLKTRLLSRLVRAIERHGSSAFP